MVLDAPPTDEWPTGNDGGPDDDLPFDEGDPSVNGSATQTRTRLLPAKVAQPATAVVNKPEHKVDALKLVKGRAVFADDQELPGMLYGGLLTSPHAHARIVAIDAKAARALPGVHAVLTYQDVPRAWSMRRAGRAIPTRPPMTR